MPPSLTGGPAVDLRRAFRPVASSVWVVTSAHGGIPVGFTAISVASVSLTPALLSFNVSRTSSSLPTLRASRRYAVHLLAADDEEAARRFAAPAGARFADPGTWTWGDEGLPALTGGATRLSGDVVSLVEAGDSLLVIGSVQRAESTGTAPLLHHDRTYLSLPSTDLVGAPR